MNIRRELLDMVTGIVVVGLVLIAVVFMLAFSNVHVSGELEGRGYLNTKQMGFPLELEEVKISFEADIPLLLVWQQGASIFEWANWGR